MTRWPEISGWQMTSTARSPWSRQGDLGAAVDAGPHREFGQGGGVTQVDQALHHRAHPATPLTTRRRPRSGRRARRAEGDDVDLVAGAHPPHQPHLADLLRGAGTPLVVADRETYRHHREASPLRGGRARPRRRAPRRRLEGAASRRGVLSRAFTRSWLRPSSSCSLRRYIFPAAIAYRSMACQSVRRRPGQHPDALRPLLLHVVDDDRPHRPGRASRYSRIRESNGRPCSAQRRPIDSVQGRSWRSCRAWRIKEMPIRSPSSDTLLVVVGGLERAVGLCLRRCTRLTGSSVSSGSRASLASTALLCRSRTSAS